MKKVDFLGTGWVYNRLVVKTGSAKTKTKTEVFETKTKTANGSVKQNPHSSRKNYFYQKLQRHWLMSSLQLSIAFSKHQVTEYSVTHAWPVGTHEDASVARFFPQGAEVAGTQYTEDTNRRRGLNCSLLRMVLTVAFVDVRTWTRWHLHFKTLFIYTGSR